MVDYRGIKKPKEASVKPPYVDEANRYLKERGPQPIRVRTDYRGSSRPSDSIGRRFETIYPQTRKATMDGEESRTGRNLGQMVAVTSAALIGGSALFLSSNLTGNVIWNLSNGEINLIGIVMFVVGLVGLFASLKGK